MAGAARKINSDRIRMTRPRAERPKLNGSRPRLAPGKQCPIEREIMKDGAIVSIEEVGGLHHRYERVAA